MKITGISAYQADITVARGGYAVSRGRIVREVDTTVVLIDTHASPPEPP